MLKFLPLILTAIVLALLLCCEVDAQCEGGQCRMPAARAAASSGPVRSIFRRARGRGPVRAIVSRFLGR